MRIQVLSDLHLDFGPVQLPRVEAEAVVIAGDVDLGQAALDWVIESFPATPVVYVLGNHEYYHGTLPALRHDFQRRCRGTNVNILENSVVEIADVLFLGCTLWTDFELCGRPTDPMRVAGERMNDFKLIRYLPEGEDERFATRLEPADLHLLHKESLRWLTASLANFSNRRVIVVTHHAPSPRSIAPRYVDHPLSPAFASNLEEFVETSGAALWVHGHVHDCFDYQIGHTRVLCNPRGYLGIDDGNGFDLALTVDV